MARIDIGNLPAQAMRSGSDLTDIAAWDYQFPNSISIDSLIYTLPELTIEVGVSFDMVLSDSRYSQDTRFLNPDKLNIGHWTSSGIWGVESDGQIQYTRQYTPLFTRVLHLSNSRPNRPKTYRALDTETEGLARNRCAIQACQREIRSPNPNDPGNTTLIGAFTEFAIDAIHLAVEPGREDFTELPPNLDREPVIQLLRGQDYPLTLSGVLWPGWRGVCQLRISAYGAFDPPFYELNYRQNPIFPVITPPDCLFVPEPPSS